MRPSSSFLLPLLLALVSSPANGATIEQTCRNAAIRQLGFNYHLCVEGLERDPTNPGTNVELQAYAAANQALERAGDVWLKVASQPLYGSSLAPLWIQCTHLYDDLRATVRTALNLLQDEQKVPGRTAAMGELVEARDSADQCPEAFAKAGKPWPFHQESGDAIDALVIAVAVLRLLMQ